MRRLYQKIKYSSVPTILDCKRSMYVNAHPLSSGEFSFP